LPKTEEEVWDTEKYNISTKRINTATMVRVTGYMFCLDCISSEFPEAEVGGQPRRFTDSLRVKV
jgi:hypothetical protein